MNRFINKYRGTIEIETIPFMPLTTLTKAEYERIIELVNFRAGTPTLWDTFTAGNILSLSIAERTLLNQVCSDWMGSGFWTQYQTLTTDFNQQ